MYNGFQKCSFGELLKEKVKNGIYKSKTFHGSGLKIVNMGELFRYPRLYDVDMKHIMVTEKEKEKFLLKNGDLLFARRSLTPEGAGKCCIVHDIESEMVFESSLIRARPDCKKVNPYFLYYYFSSHLGIYLLYTIRRQVAVSGITGTDLMKLVLDIPPLSEQQAIAHILGTLDDKIELNRRQNATLEAMAQAIFKEWFMDFGPVRAKMEGRQPEGMSREIADLFPDRLDDEGKPEGWEWAVLSDCCEINPKRVLQKNKYASYLDMSNMPTINALPHKWNMRNFTSGMKFMNGDTLIARITPCLENGKTAFVDFLKNGEVGWGSTEYIVLRPKANISPFWGYLLSKTDEFRKFAIQSMTGTSGRQRVQVDQLACFQIVKAPDTIHNIVKIQFDSIVRKLSKNRNEANILIDIRDTLLPKLISGELRVPDAEKMVADIV